MKKALASLLAAGWLRRLLFNGGQHGRHQHCCFHGGFFHGRVRRAAGGRDHLLAFLHAGRPHGGRPEGRR